MDTFRLILFHLFFLALAVEVHTINIFWVTSDGSPPSPFDQGKQVTISVESFNELDNNEDFKNKLSIFIMDRKGSDTIKRYLGALKTHSKDYDAYTETNLYFLTNDLMDQLSPSMKARFQPKGKYEVPTYPLFHLEKKGKELKHYTESGDANDIRGNVLNDVVQLQNYEEPEPSPAPEPAQVEEPEHTEPEPAAEPEHKAEPVQEPAPKEPEPVQEPAPKEPEPVQEPAPKEPEPVQEPAPKEPEPVQEPAPKEPDPVKEPVYKNTVPVYEHTVPVVQPGRIKQGSNSYAGDFLVAAGCVVAVLGAGTTAYYMSR